MSLQNRVLTRREFRVSFEHPVAAAAVVDRNRPLPPLAARASSAPPQALPSPTPPPPVANLHTEIARQMADDRQHIDRSLDNIRERITALKQEHTAMLQSWQHAAVEMALTIASKLLHREIVAGEFPVENMIRDMGGQLYDDPIVRIRLNPKDIELLEQRLDGQPLMDDPRDPAIVPDATLGRADCRIEAESGVLLTDLATQLRQIREDLLRSLHDDRA